jgi:cysteine-rich repeat protein
MRMLPLLLTCPLCACLSQRTRDYLDGLNASESESTLDSTSGESSSSSSGTTTGSSSGETTSSGGSSSSSSSEVSGSTSSSTGIDASSSTSSSGTTGEPGPVCGNNIVEDRGPLPEECDDGNTIADDGCSETCAVDVLAFVTSVDYQGGDLMGVYLADSQCANRADDAGVPGALRFRAWLSDSTTDARDRIKMGRGRLVMVNGVVLAESWEALLATELLAPLEVTEKSETYHGGVWTGTNPDGTEAEALEADNCEDWTNSSAFHRGFWGRSDRVDVEWTFRKIDNPIPCGDSYAIYCFQEP